MTICRNKLSYGTGSMTQSYLELIPFRADDDGVSSVGCLVRVAVNFHRSSDLLGIIRHVWMCQIIHYLTMFNLNPTKQKLNQWRIFI